jgi:hypothetical protein
MPDSVEQNPDTGTGAPDKNGPAGEPQGQTASTAAQDPTPPIDCSKAALVLAFQEVVNASAILAALITGEQTTSRGGTLNSTRLTGASCTKNC